MNELINILKEKYPEYTYSYNISDSVLNRRIVVYFSYIRVIIYPNVLEIYKNDKGEYFYVKLATQYSGLDKVDYFNLSLEYDLHEILLKENIDFIWSMWNNLPHHLMTMSIRKS